MSYPGSAPCYRRKGPLPHNPCVFCKDELPLTPLIELRYGSQRFRFCRLACLVTWCETDPATPALPMGVPA